MNNPTTLFWVFLFARLLIGHEAMAAPLKITTSLPLTGNDIAQAKAALETQEVAEQFTHFIKSLGVFPDHRNPTEISEIENRAIKKRYFVVPYFQASEERYSVGGQEIADQGIKTIAEAYDLLGAFD